MVITDICFNGTLTVGINFKKANDRAPHEWVTAVLDTVCVPEVGHLQPLYKRGPQKGKLLTGPEIPNTTSGDGNKCLSSRDTYSYLCVEQLFGKDDKKVKDSVIAVHRKRLYNYDDNYMEVSTEQAPWSLVSTEILVSDCAVDYEGELSDEDVLTRNAMKLTFRIKKI